MNEYNYEFEEEYLDAIPEFPEDFEVKQIILRVTRADALCWLITSNQVGLIPTPATKFQFTF